ncbi:alpha/beta hydrolase-fold protein [Fulvivirgaceae bacterium BMA12]|uniref:Alpha/beta hydrolase-fold protein n=1 Tax=Agaribacillus aureus TaxID=3051825 RepID=A0ABT8LDR1_9BACT|nr:alpha/beta hydrolase-fold protein [Fulvivirgaceae bacterium BMA12]
MSSFLKRLTAFLLVSSAAISALPGQGIKGLKGTLTGNQIIKSQSLGYSLQYRVYTPPNSQNLKDIPVVYVTDGQWYISKGSMPKVVDQLIFTHQIKPIIAVFIDNRDPYDLKTNRRNNQFLCNKRFLQFVKNELVSVIDKGYRTDDSPQSRAIMGISFGGLNAGYFGANAYDTFGLVAMMSPALHPCRDIYEQYEAGPKKPLKIYLSTGAKNDTEVGTRYLKKVLDKQGYQIKYQEVDEEHNWNNWRPLIDDALIYFFSK